MKQGSQATLTRSEIALIRSMHRLSELRGTPAQLPPNRTDALCTFFLDGGSAQGKRKLRDSGFLGFDQTEGVWTVNRLPEDWMADEKSPAARPLPKGDDSLRFLEAHCALDVGFNLEQLDRPPAPPDAEPNDHSDEERLIKQTLANLIDAETATDGSVTTALMNQVLEWTAPGANHLNVKFALTKRRLWKNATKAFASKTELCYSSTPEGRAHAAGVSATLTDEQRAELKRRIPTLPEKRRRDWEEPPAPWKARTVEPPRPLAPRTPPRIGPPQAPVVPTPRAPAPKAPADEPPAPAPVAVAAPVPVAPPPPPTPEPEEHSEPEPAPAPPVAAPPEPVPDPAPVAAPPDEEQSPLSLRISYRHRQALTTHAYVEDLLEELSGVSTPFLPPRLSIRLLRFIWPNTGNVAVYRSQMRPYFDKEETGAWRSSRDGRDYLKRNRTRIELDRATAISWLIEAEVLPQGTIDPKDRTPLLRAQLQEVQDRVTSLRAVVGAQQAVVDIATAELERRQAQLEHERRQLERVQRELAAEEATVRTLEEALAQTTTAPPSP